MINLFAVLGVAFLIKGILFTMGRTVPKGVAEKLRDRVQLENWCRGTGTVHILWGASCLFLWAANMWVHYSLILLCAFALSIVASIVVMLYTTKKHNSAAR